METTIDEKCRELYKQLSEEYDKKLQTPEFNLLPEEEQAIKRAEVEKIKRLHIQQMLGISINYDFLY